MTAQSALMQGPEATERFHRATQDQTVYIHIQKRCTAGCNAVVIDRILKRFGGMCEKCFNKGVDQ